jgi:hypothetical protein
VGFKSVKVFENLLMLSGCKATELSRRNTMHDLIVGVAFIAMIAAPCVIAMFRGNEETI